MSGELISVIDYWSRDKGIKKETLLSAVQDCLVSAAKKALGPTRDLRCEINPKTGAIKAFARLIVVESVDDCSSQISLAEARMLKPDVQCGDEVEKEVTPHDFGRIAAQYAKHNLLQMIRRIEKAKIYDEFKDRVGDVVDGRIEHFDKRGDVIVDLGRYEAKMPSEERVVDEKYSLGDRLRFYVQKVVSNNNTTEIILSRKDPMFVVRLFEIEISEIKDGTIEVCGVARDCKSKTPRTKIAVYSKDPKVDPVGACVGLRGQRVKSIVRELNNEKIDIVKYDPDIVRFVANALSPAKMVSCEVMEQDRRLLVTVSEDQRSLAIGKTGQNIKLISQLVKWKVDVVKEKPEEKTMAARVADVVADFTRIFGITDEQARSLVRTGFTSVEVISNTQLDDLKGVEGIEESAESILETAKAEYARVQNQ